MSPSHPFRLVPSAAAICLLAHNLAHAQADAAPAPEATASAQTASKPKSAASQLTTVVITSERAKGFSSQVVGVGAFRDQRPVDVPLTNSVITREVLDSQGASTVMDAMRNTAGVTRAQTGAAFSDNLAVRGIPMENRSSYRLNGSLPLIAVIPIPMEDKERVEVLKGASSMYYGMVPPSGIVSFEMKRAGLKPVSSLSMAVNEWGAYTAAVDIGRRFGDEDRFGLRVNAAGGTDAPGLRNYDGKRSLFAVAFDYRVNHDLTLKLDFEHYNKKATEQAAVRLIGTATVLPRAPANRTNLAGEWAQTDATSTNAMLRAEWSLSNDWTLVAEYGQANAKRDRLFTQFAFNSIAGYTTGEGRVFGTFNKGVTYNNKNTRLDLLGRIETGPFAHELTFGYTRNERFQDLAGTNAQSWGCATLTATCSLTSARNVAQNLYNTIDVPLQTQTAPNAPLATSIVDTGVYMVDRIILSPKWHVMLGLRHTQYTSEQTDPVLTTPGYKTTQSSPNVSMIYKPTAGSSIYASRLRGLEAGANVGTSYSNFGALLPAAVTTQYELGGKLQLKGGTLLQLAYFDIRRAQNTNEPAPPGSSAPPANPNSPPSTWLIQTQNGEVKFRGLEFAASGELSKNIGVVASAMWMDPKITKDSTVGPTNTLGKIPGNTAKKTFSLFGEYRFDSVRGLSVNAAAYGVGSRPASTANNVFLPGVTTYSVGARYRTDLYGKPAILQLNVDNATNKSYWSSADATNANPLISYGLPRVIRASAKVDF